MGQGGKELPEAEAVVVAGRYRLERYLAKGGVGVVYRAHDESTDRAVALKRMLDHAVGSQRLRTLFEREYHTLARLKHPRIIEVYDYGIAEGTPYYTMELLDGKDLGELAPIPYKQACKYLRDVASSLALLHSRHLLHRDLSARNVRHTSDDRCKLLDFGTMASFGMATEIVGTPPLVAPESMRGTALDHRADLYSLGALAYRILTRRYAYRARQLEDLPELWRTAPPPPSEVVAGIPEELDRLVMSLLDLNPVMRPRSASEVIDRLTVIGDLPPETDTVETAQSYLLSSRMVGRDQHLERLTARIKRAVGGTGATVVIEGNPGVGKTRLLEEAGLQAQLLGALTIRADARAHREPSGVALALASSMLHTAPHEARRALGTYESVLAPLLPELRGDTSSSGKAPNVDMAMLQQALSGWFTRMAETQPLVLMVDDLQRTDESSGAFLVALARASARLPLLILGTRRLAGSVSAPRALRSLMEGARRVRLHRLKRSGTAEMVKGLFGDVPNADKTAQWMHDLTTGSPMQTMELSQHLVDQGVIRYTGGLWVLPLEMPAGELPQSLAATMHARAAGLRPEARALAEALSVRRGVLPLTLCLALADGQQTSEAVFGLLDELIARGALVAAAGGYAFAQDALRETLLSEMDRERRRQLHRRLAEALLTTQGASPSEQLEAGWHLMRAGEESRGAELLEQAARHLAPRGDAIASSLPALEAALEVADRERRAPYRRIRLRATLAGSYDRGAVQRHAVSTIDALARQAGIRTMRVLQPVLGRKIGYWLALFFASVRHALTPNAMQSVRPTAAVAYLYRCAYSALVVGSAGMQLPILREIQRYLVRLTPTPHIGRLTHALYEGTILVMSGQPNRARKAALRTRALLPDDGIPGIPPASYHGIQAGAFITQGMIEAQSSLHGKAALDVAEALERIAERTSQVATDAGAGYLTVGELERAARQIRLVYHTMRGESEDAAALRQDLELQALQSGLHWQFDIWKLLLEAEAAQRTGDLTVLRRNLEQLRDIADDDPHLTRFRTAVQLSLWVALGQYDQVIETGLKLHPESLAGQLSGWDTIINALSESYIRTGQPERAVRLLQNVLSQPFDDRDQESTPVMALEASLAIALASAGELDEAQIRIDDLVRRTEQSDQPMLRGIIHEVGARVAWMRNDRKLFDAHVQHMRHWYARTRNAALLTRGQRIAGLFRQQVARGAEDGAEADITRVNVRQAIDGLNDLMAGCRDAEERATRALRLVIEQAGSTGGHLYLMRKDRLRLAASVDANEPQDELEAAIIRQVRTRQSSPADSQPVDAATTAQSQVVSLGAEGGTDAQYVTALLRTRGQDAPMVIGAIALRVGRQGLLPVREIYLQALSSCLRDDVIDVDEA